MADKPEVERDADGRISVLLEMRAELGASPSLGLRAAQGLGGGVLALDEEFVPVPLSNSTGQEFSTGVPDTYVLRGTVSSESDIKQLEKDPRVVKVWTDTVIGPFGKAPKKKTADQSSAQQMNRSTPMLDDNLAAGACPIGTCDCDPNLARGTIADVARYLGVDQIWNQGYRGAGIVVGVVDGGITAQGRAVKPGETANRIGRVIGGWPVADWGTEASRWGEHGNMCATDVLGMAPEAQLYDLRIGGSGGSVATISRALQAFQWAIDRYRIDGTPQILSNSWGIYQEAWDATYARDPSHPFTRKVAEAINLGIVVLFAAGNCGDTCPDGRCGPDVGSGRSIWGANGHPQVMTVGAVNINEQFVGYSSRGPAALDPNKPDFCAITHFRGYFPDADSGTSAATPILAGAVALLKQASPSISPARVKAELIATCKDIGPVGFDVNSGHGIVRPRDAFDRIMRPAITQPGIETAVVRDLVGTRITLDSPQTPVLLDRLGTRVTLDNPRTPILLDNPRTPVLLDSPRTAPLMDQPQTAPGADAPNVPPIRHRYSMPGIYGSAGQEQPFVLSTGHHAPDWRSFEDMAGGQAEDADPLAQLSAQIDEVYAVLEALVNQYQEAVQAQGGRGPQG